MASFLQGDLAKAIHAAMKDTVAYDITLTSVTTVPAGGGSFTTTTSDGTVKGWVEDYKDFYLMQGMIQSGDRKIMILQQSTTVIPKVRDKVTARGETYDIMAVSQDPASALWELQGRPA